MEKEFKKAFIDYAEHERATKELKELRMKDGNVDHYVARFRQLAMQGGHDLDQPQILNMFAQGLPRPLADKCFDLDPEDFDQWVLTAQRCQRIYLKRQAAQGNFTANSSSPWRKLQWGNQGKGRGGQGRGGQRSSATRYTPHDPDAMDTSATVRKATTEAEKAKHRQEGRCYECSQQGHMARTCPTKKPKVRKAAIEEVKEDFTSGDVLADYALKLSEEARDSFIKKIMGTCEEDFSEA
jgi:hypothetical protein